jgi:hypothetical protein
VDYKKGFDNFLAGMYYSEIAADWMQQEPDGLVATSPYSAERIRLSFTTNIM